MARNYLFRPLMPCRHDGCSTLTRTGYCGLHAPVKNETAEKKGAKQYNYLYGTAGWKNLRVWHLIVEPYCRECKKNGEPDFPASDVDHIIPHRGDRELFFDTANLQSLCHYHHKQKTAREVNARRREEKQSRTAN